MLVAGQNLARSQALAKVAMDLYAIGIGSSPAEMVERMLLAVETGQSRGLKSLGLYVNLTQKQEIAALKQIRSPQLKSLSDGSGVCWSVVEPAFPLAVEIRNPQSAI